VFSLSGLDLNDDILWLDENATGSLEDLLRNLDLLGVCVNAFI
jgi:hypothetical protein